jgi:hypothetical protein
MTEIREFEETLEIPIRPDAKGFIGRQCPNPSCNRYFKVKFGTGLPTRKMHCPYCGHLSESDDFYTEDQLRHVTSQVLRYAQNKILRELQGLVKPASKRAPSGFSAAIEIRPGHPAPIFKYDEKALETDIVCQTCSLGYSIYGRYACCPDCGSSNSLQIFESNLLSVDKILGLGEKCDPESQEDLAISGLYMSVAAFDGFGREFCRSNSEKAKDPSKVIRTSFQRIEEAKDRLADQFGIDISQAVSPEEWRHCVICFHKRHCFSHNEGVVDKKYLERSGDTSVELGRLLPISRNEIAKLSSCLGKIARSLDAVA